MINLLSDTQKADIIAARTNVALFRYIIIVAIAIVLLVALLVGTYIVLNSAQANAKQKVAENEQRVAMYADTKTQAESFRTDLSTAKTILDSKTPYTKLIYKIASAIPQNVIIDSLTLDPKTLGSSMTFNANAKTFSDATKIKEAFSNNGELFTNVQLQSIRSGGTTSTSGDDAYPVKVVVSATLNKEALK